MRQRRGLTSRQTRDGKSFCGAEGGFEPEAEVSARLRVGGSEPKPDIQPFIQPIDPLS